MNIWISAYGASPNRFGEFPYKAYSPSLQKTITFEDEQSIYDELDILADEAERQGWKVGESLYKQLRFFCNDELFLSNSIQNDIKKYHYSTISHTSPYASIDGTPATFIDKFLLIHSEIKYIKSTLEKEKEKNAN